MRITADELGILTFQSRVVRVGQMHVNPYTDGNWELREASSEDRELLQDPPFHEVRHLLDAEESETAE